MAGTIHIEYQGLIPWLGEFAKREWQRIQREAWLIVGRRWHERMRPKHFKRSAISEYGYKPRGAKYEARKFREKGHRDPLVFTGASRRSTATGRITATYHGVRVAMTAPNLNRDPRLREELTRITPREAEELGRTLDREIERRIKAGGSIGSRISKRAA